MSRFGASSELKNQRSSSPCAARRAPASRNSVPTRAASPPKTSALSPSPSTGSGRSRATAAFACRTCSVCGSSCRTSSVRGSPRCPVPAPASPPLGPGSGRAPSTARRSTKLEPTRDPELDGPASDKDGKLRRRRDELVLLSVAVPFAVAFLGAPRFSGHAACAASMHSRAPGPAGGLGQGRHAHAVHGSVIHARPRLDLDTQLQHRLRGARGLLLVRGSGSVAAKALDWNAPRPHNPSWWAPQSTQIRMGGRDLAVLADKNSLALTGLHLRR